MFLNRYFLLLVCSIFANKVCVPSQFVFQSFRELKGKLKLIYLGYTPPENISTNTSVSFPLKVIYCAKFHKAKNHYWLINALENEIKAQRVQLILPGDGTELDNIKLKIATSDFPCDAVILPGWLNQTSIKTLYAASHLAVIPSSSETFGHNIVEPLSFGLPVISFPVGVVPDITSGLAIQSIPFFDQKALISSLMVFYEKNELYNLAKEEALTIFMKNFSWKKHMLEYETLVKSC